MKKLTTPKWNLHIIKQAKKKGGTFWHLVKFPRNRRNDLYGKPKMNGKICIKCGHSYDGVKCRYCKGRKKFQQFWRIKNCSSISVNLERKLLHFPQTLRKQSTNMEMVQWKNNLIYLEGILHTIKKAEKSKTVEDFNYIIIDYYRL